MFVGDTKLTQVNEVNMPRLTFADEMFDGCTELQGTVTVTAEADALQDVQRMFRGCSKLSEVNFSNVPQNITNTSSAFEGCSSLERVTTSSVDDDAITTLPLVIANDMFNGCSSLTEINLPLNVDERLTDCERMFSGCEKITNVDFLSNNVRPVNVKGMFRNCKSLISLDDNIIGFNKVRDDISETFYGCIALTGDITINEGKSIKSAVRAFSYTENLNSVTFVDNDLSNLISATEMFKKSNVNVTNLNQIVKSGLNNLIMADSMFEDYKNLTTFITDGCADIVAMNRMFAGNENLTTVVFNNTCDDVEELEETFLNCTSLQTLTLSVPNVVKLINPFGGVTSLTDAEYLFSNHNSLLTVSGDYSSFTTAFGMFENCYSLQTVQMKVTNLETANSMFQNCSSLTSVDLDKSDNIVDAPWMFDGCTSLTHFRGNLTNLDWADSMFNGTKLDQESVEYIINQLRTKNTNAEDAPDMYVITIGVNAELQNTSFGQSLPQTVTTPYGGTWSLNIQWN